MTTQQIKVNEIFGPTIQGEGKNAGKPTMFLRLVFCNLHCVWCDTPHTWNWKGTRFAHPEKYDKDKETHNFTFNQIVAQLIQLDDNTTRSLVVSGGEPLIQQKQLIPLFKRLKELGWWIEIETNGTIIPKDEIFNLVDQINCSPKLSNSGDSRKLRVKPKALGSLARNSKTNFKFVVGVESDIPEILRFVHYIHKCGDSEIRLMPLCQTKDELLSREPMVKKLCEEHGFIYTSRLSILQSGTKRGI